MNWNYWDKHWDFNDRFVKYFYLLKNTLFDRIFAKHLGEYITSNNDIILEAGCGSGVISLKILDKHDANMVLLDISSKPLKISQKNFMKAGKKFLGIQGDILQMPFKDNTFDVVWNQGVVEHFNKPDDAIKEMHRTVKYGGYAVFFVPAHLSILHMFYLLSMKTKSKPYLPFGEQIFFTKKQIKEILNSLGYYSHKIVRPIETLYFSLRVSIKKDYNLFSRRNPT